MSGCRRNGQLTKIRMAYDLYDSSTSKINMSVNDRGTELAEEHPLKDLSVTLAKQAWLYRREHGDSMQSIKYRNNTPLFVIWD